jgi:POT family proton-dependent oligopeptide transporter
MLVYIMSIPGGMIADKVLGQKRPFFRSDYPLSWAWCFDLDGYLGLYTGLVIAGVGLLKPNISTMVGGLYPQGDIRRDKGFSIFYIGINTGSLLATMVIGFVVGDGMQVLV